VNGQPLNFKVYQSKEVNAFAMPDGSIRIYSGLMDKMNDNELAFVIGHEIGHVAEGHSKKRFQTALLVGAGRDALGNWGGKIFPCLAPHNSEILSQKSSMLSFLRPTKKRRMTMA